MLNSFQKTKENIRDALEQLKTVTDGNASKRAEEIISKLDQEQFILVVVGQFKRGKTAFINALLGKEILPSAIIPLTSIITIVEYGKELKAEVNFLNGKREIINPEDLPLFVTEKHNPKNEKMVDFVNVYYPSDYLKNGIKLVDTPGIASIHDHNTKATYDYLPEADAGIFLVSVDPPITKAEFEFLNDIKPYIGKIFFIQNKIDTVGEKDKKESLEFTKKVIEENVHIPDVKIYPLSAKLALEAKYKKDNNLLVSSGISKFEKILDDFLIREKGNTLLQSIINKSLCVVEQELLLLNIKQKSLEESAETLNEKLNKFNLSMEDIARERTNGEYFLDGEIQHIIKDVVEEDINEFRKEKTRILTLEAKEYFNKSGIQNADELSRILNSFISKNIQEAFNEFKDNEEKKLNDCLEKGLSQFEGRINDTIQKVMKISADIFHLSFDNLKMDREIAKKSEFHFRIDDVKVALEMITESLSLFLPNAIRRKKLLKQAEEQITQQVDMFSGRLRYDFSQRIQKAKQDSKRKLNQEVNEIIASISEAIRTGIIIKKKSEKEMTEECGKINGKISQLSEIKTKLGEIKKAGV